MIILMAAPEGVNRSPPVRGAWVEMASLALIPQSRKCRPLCGGRGLKYLIQWELRFRDGSPPVRGAWVEITTGVETYLGTRSPPVRGAWVEIGGNTVIAPKYFPSPPVRGAWVEITPISKRRCPHARRPLCGGRGLKSVWRLYAVLHDRVAPCAGGVG